MGTRLQTAAARSFAGHDHIMAAESSRRPSIWPIAVACATSDERLPLVDIGPEGFTLRSWRPFAADGVLYFRFTVGPCLSLTLPARVADARLAARSTRGPAHVTRFQFALDQGEDDIERIVSLLVEAATRAETVH